MLRLPRAVHGRRGQGHRDGGGVPTWHRPVHALTPMTPKGDHEMMIKGHESHCPVPRANARGETAVCLCKWELPRTVRASELRLGDVVQSPRGIAPYGTCTVKQIEGKLITMFRPYVHTADFSFTGGVLCYIGVEEF